MLALLLLAICGANGTHAAHPFHVCIAQMEWNAESRFWEVSIRLHPQDLERAVSQSRGKPTSIEDPDFSKHAIPFLNKQFAIVDAPRSMAIEVLLEKIDSDQDVLARSELQWVGMEPERGWLWIHLEMIPANDSKSSDPSEHSSWLVHRIFLDTIDRQENSVRVIRGKDRYSLQFQRGKEAQAMKADTVASKE